MSGPVTAPGQTDGRQCGNPACDALLVRRPKEQSHRFRDRRFCSVRCGNAVRQVPRRLGVEEKPCQGCDATCRRRPDESASCWASRRYCTALCARRARVVPDAPKTCPLCGESFTRRVGEETSYHYKHRVTCSKACSNRRMGQARTVDPDREKTCPQCETSFTRRIGGETVGEFEERVHCSRACHLAARRVSDLPVVKTCERCGGEYGRPAGSGPKQWGARRFCSHACAVGAQQAGAVARRATPRRRKPVPVRVPSSAPQVVWRPAAWGGPVVVAPAVEAG